MSHVDSPVDKKGYRVAAVMATGHPAARHGSIPEEIGAASVPVIPKAKDGEGSSSSYAFSPVNAWSVGFNDGFVLSGHLKTGHRWTAQNRP